MATTEIKIQKLSCVLSTYYSSTARGTHVLTWSTPGLFLCVSELNINGIIQHTLFCVGFLYSHAFATCPCCFVCSFYYQVNIPLYEYITCLDYCCVFFLWGGFLLGIKSRASCMLGKSSIAELHPSAS
jgi:hypothetical protein